MFYSVCLKVLSTQKRKVFTGSDPADKHYLTLTHMNHAFPYNTNNTETNFSCTQIAAIKEKKKKKKKKNQHKKGN
jgi:hypothetical protein